MLTRYVEQGFLGNRTVAVKRILNKYTFDEKLFRREVNNLIGVDQQNVVRFLGFCSNTEHTLMPFEGKQVFAERRERLLCFEYIGNGSLDNYINGIFFIVFLQFPHFMSWLNSAFSMRCSMLISSFGRFHASHLVLFLSFKLCR